MKHYVAKCRSDYYEWTRHVYVNRRLVDHFTRHNCINSQTGKYPAYYVLETQNLV